MMTILSYLARLLFSKNPQNNWENPEHRHDLLQHELNVLHTEAKRQDERTRWRTKMDLKVRDEWETMARLKNHAEEG